MGKRLTSGSAIVKQSQPQSLTHEQQRTAIIATYLYKFGAICGKTIDEELIRIYVEALSGYDTDRLTKGLKEYLAHGTKWPWPGDLGDFIDEEV